LHGCDRFNDLLKEQRRCTLKICTLKSSNVILFISTILIVTLICPGQGYFSISPSALELRRFCRYLITITFWKESYQFPSQEQVGEAIRDLGLRVRSEKKGLLHGRLIIHCPVFSSQRYYSQGLTTSTSSADHGHHLDGTDRTAWWLYKSL